MKAAKHGRLSCGSTQAAIRIDVMAASKIFET